MMNFDQQVRILVIKYQEWQNNYEHIIRNQKSYQAITEYILKNPEKRNDD